MSHDRQRGSDGKHGGNRTETTPDRSPSGDDNQGTGRYVTDGGRSGMGTASGFDLGELVRGAGLAAVVIVGIRIVISILTNLIGGGSLINVGGLLSQIIGIIGTLAFIAAIVAVAILGAEKQVVLWGSVAIYALGLLDSILSSFVRSVLSPGLAGLGLGINTLIFPLYTVVTFLGIVMAYRLIQGKTILPGVDVRL